MQFEEHPERAARRDPVLKRSILVFLAGTFGLGLLGGGTAFVLTVMMTTCGCAMEAFPPAQAATRSAEPLLVDLAVASAEGVGVPGQVVRLTHRYGATP